MSATAIHYLVRQGCPSGALVKVPVNITWLSRLSVRMNLSNLVGENQSIKIVPSMQETLRNSGLNVDLDGNTELWLTSLKNLWKTWKRNATVEESVEMFFNSVPDPHRIALVFVINCEEFKDCKLKTLPYFIVESLYTWSQKNKVQPIDTLKLPAFRIAIQQRSQQFLNLMVKTYQIQTIKESIIPTVREMIHNDNSKQASQIVIAMELFKEIPVQDLLFPMIIQDKLNMIDEYLAQCPSQVKSLVLFLDGLLDRNFNIREFVQQYLEENKIYYVKYEKLHHKPLGKLVARLCNKYNIPIETCKNLGKNRIIGGLKYLINQKYLEKKISSAVWDDLVKDALRQNADSGKYFIDILVDYDIKEALKWAEYLKLPDTELPLALRELSLDDKNTAEECWDDTDDNSTPNTACYKLPISDEQIHLIDTAEKFYDFIMTDLKGHAVVAIDCEWKPSFGATHSQVALIQIAVPGKVFLIDAVFLNKPEYSSFWQTFHRSFLDNAEIIKLGFGLEQDFKEMKASVIGLSNLKVKGEGLLDLCALRQYLCDIGVSLPNNSESVGYSLSSMVQSCFGLPLEKSEQCSNWELRPLRQTQVHYAALDAYILLELYSHLQNLCQEQCIDFEEVCNDVMQDCKGKSGIKNSIAEKKKKLALATAAQPAKTAKEVKILVEPGVSSLMAYLRYCGIDTTVAPANMLWHDFINLAIYENRLVLVSKFKISPFRNFSQSSLLDMGGNLTIKEQLHKVFEDFKITVEQNYLLTRCMMCNTQNLKKLSADEVSHLCMPYECATTGPDIRVCDDEDNYDAFLSDSDEGEYSHAVIPQNNIAHKTTKGATINISSIGKLKESPQPAILCENCGKLFWEEDEHLKSVADSVNDLIKLRIPKF